MTDTPLEWKENYPIDIFPNINKARLREVNGYLKVHFGFPLDRLSAHIARKVLANRLEEVQAAKRGFRKSMRKDGHFNRGELVFIEETLNYWFQIPDGEAKE